MLSGKGNEDSEKNNDRCDLQKSNFARAAHFLYISLPLFCTTT